MQVDEVKRLRELEAENARLKRLLAESALEIDAIREVLRGSVVTQPSATSTATKQLQPHSVSSAGSETGVG
jgi:hypothetical protein